MVLRWRSNVCGPTTFVKMSAGFLSVGMYFTVTVPGRLPAPRTKLTHLEHLTVDMARVLGGGVTMAQIVSALVVSVDGDLALDLVGHEGRELLDV